MPRSGSDELFHLVKSLSLSELSKLRDSIGNSRLMSIPKGETPKYIQLIDFLIKQEKFNDYEAKLHFGFKEKNSAGWRQLKNKAFDQSMKAILFANENQTEYADVHQKPILLRHLFERGIFEKAERMARKALDTARDRQVFYLVPELADIYSELIIVNQHPDEARRKLEELFEFRKDANLKQNNLQQLKELWHLLTVEARRAAYPNNAVIDRILGNSIISGKVVRTEQAELLYWRIVNRCYFVKREHRIRVSALEKAIMFCEKSTTLENGDYISIYLGFLKDRGLYEVLAHRFEEALRFETKMKAVIESNRIAGRLKTGFESKLHEFRLSRFFKASNFEKLENAIKDAVTWLGSHRFLLDDKSVKRLHRLIATYSFHIGDYSSAIKWIFPLRTKDHTHLSAFAWIFYLIARFENNDFEIIATQLKDTVTQLERALDSKSPYIHLVKLIGKSKSGSWKDNSMIAQLQQKLEIEATTDKLNYYFPFSLWLNRFASGKTMWQEIQNQNVPIYDP